MAQHAGAVGHEIDPGDQQEWLLTSEVLQKEIRDPTSCAAEHARAESAGSIEAATPSSDASREGPLAAFIQDHRPCCKPRMTGNRPASPDIGSGLGHKDRFLPPRLSGGFVLG